MSAAVRENDHVQGAFWALVFVVLAASLFGMALNNETDCHKIRRLVSQCDIAKEGILTCDGLANIAYEECPR